MAGTITNSIKLGARAGGLDVRATEVNGQPGAVTPRTSVATSPRVPTGSAKDWLGGGRFGAVP